MKPKEIERAFQQRLIESIQFVGLNNSPDEWLPMKVTVIEYPEDENGEPQQRLAECRLKDICECEECCMREIGTNTDDPYGLCEIINKSLIEIWEKYVSTSKKEWRSNAIAYLKSHTKAPDNVIEAFVDTEWNREELLADNLDAFHKVIDARK